MGYGNKSKTFFEVTFLIQKQTHFYSSLLDGSSN